MSDSTVTGSVAARPAAQDRGSERRQIEIDWSATERTPEFRELVRRRRRFVVPATIFFLCWYFGFVALCGYAPDFMGREFLADGVTVGYALALTQFVMTWGLAWLYLRKSDRVFDPLAERAAEKAIDISSRPRGDMSRARVPTEAGTEVIAR